MYDDDIGAGDLTRMAILAFLGQRGPASRATIARDLDVSPATVSQVTKRLLDHGVIETLDFAPSEGGRPGQRLGLVGSAGRAIGVKLAADHLVLVDVRLDGQVVAAALEPYDALAPDALERLVKTVESFLAGAEERLLGIGVGVPGIVARPDVGDVDAAVLDWSAKPVGRFLRKAIGVPVVIENDVKSLAVAQRLFGCGRGHRSFALVTIGRGVGFASVADGTLRRGSHGGAGELAHIVIAANGPQCACGQRGCLEAFVGAEGLMRTARAAGVLGKQDDLERLRSLADEGVAGARRVFAGAARRLAAAVSPAIAVLDPEVLVVAGEGTSSWQHWDAAFCSQLRRVLPSQMRGLTVEVDPWDESSWARGAAATVLATPFDRHALAGRQRTAVLARLHGLGDDADLDEPDRSSPLGSRRPRPS